MNDLRVMAGKYKGMSLKVPQSARPVTTRVKAVIFDTLMNYIQGSKVLDLFAGSGNLGIEALSRGAEYAIFVDHNDESIRLINENLRKVRAEENSNVVKSDYKVFLKRTTETFDLIFIDPPFEFISELSLTHLVNVLNDQGIVVLKTPKNSYVKIPSSFKVHFEKSIGENRIFFIGQIR